MSESSAGSGAGSAPDSVALLGLGAMGLGMARNILSAGLRLRVWNRTREKAEPLGRDGAYVARDVEDAVAGAGLVVTMLFDLESVADVIGRATGAFAPGAVWVQMATVGVPGSERLARLADELGLGFVDAPVMGTRKPAEDGALVILASGPEALRARCAALFEAVGRRTVWVGTRCEGSRLKLVANAWVLAMIEGIAESITLAEALGLDPRLFFAALEGGAMSAPYVEVKGDLMLAGVYPPAFTVAGALKDAGLVLEAATDAGVRMGLTEVVRGALAEVAGAGYGDEDMAAVFRASRREEPLFG